jgi:hypothetical protein
MNKIARQSLFWTPRVLGMLYALFISIFALDVFEGNHGFWETALALMMHLIPTGLLLIVLVIAWRWEWAGALLYIGLGLWYSLTFARHHPQWILTIAGPIFLIGALFLAGWFCRAKLRPAT